MLTRTAIANMHAMLENNMAFYSKKADSGRKTRAKGLRHYFKKIARNPSGHAVLEWEVPSSSDDTKHYDCYIGIAPKNMSLFTIASGSGNIQAKMQLVKNADVTCFCTCPDFNWSGAKYNMKHRYDGFEEGHTSEDGVPAGEDIPPRVRDPMGKNVVCKHLLACFSGMLTNAGTIMKTARTTKFKTEPPSDDQVKTMNQAGKPEKQAGNGEIKQANSGTAKKPITGEIKQANSGQNAKPLTGYPSEDEAIKVLGESTPVKIPEAQKALDALANEIPVLGNVKEETPEEPGNGEVLQMNDGEENEEDTGEENEEIKLLNGKDKYSPLTDIEDAATLKMFNGAQDEEE